MIATAATALAVFVSLTGTAAAKTVHQHESNFALGSVLAWLSVDNSAGPSANDVYVGELSQATFASRVFQADATGAPTGVELDGSETPAGSFGFINFATFNLASGPAVDSSGGARAGEVYVPDVANGVVDVFNEAGEYVCQITGSATPSPSECAGPAGSETPTGGLQPLSVAIDPNDGTVAVGDARGVIYEFDEGGEYLGEVADPHITAPFDLAFDSVGSLYVVNANLFGSGPGSAVKFDAGGSFAYELASSRSSVGVDLGNDHVYLGSNEAETEIEEFDSSGSPVGSFAGPTLSVDASEDTHNVYVVGFGAGEIWSTEFVPAVATGAADAVGESAATLHGEVDPELAEGGTPVERCTFEYGATAAYGQSVQCSPAVPYTAATDVSAALSGLDPSTTYHYRLVAENEDGHVGQGEERTFTTFGAPGITGEKSIARTSSATVKAQINPFGYETICEVEYASDAMFQAGGYDNATTVPCDDPVAAGFGDQTATARLTGLTIGTVYHFRFVAHNAATSQGGTTVGSDHVFSTFGIKSFSVEALDAEGHSYPVAGGRPYEVKVSFEMETTEALTDQYPASVEGNLRTVRVHLPPGLVGNPMAVPRCPSYDVKLVRCAPETQVGIVRATMSRMAPPEVGELFNVQPPEGVAGQISGRFNSFGTVRVAAGVRSGGDYGIDAETLSVTADDAVSRVEMTLWGVPADESHDARRLCRTGVAGCASGAPLRPFFTNPTACTGSLGASLAVDSWQEPGNFVSRDSSMPGMEGCDRLDFRPEIKVKPGVTTSESPSGVRVNLHVPQNEDPGALATAHLKDTTVRLPEGLAVNPSGANGLAACSIEQIGYKTGTSAPAEFTAEPAQCPEAAKIGSVEVHTPLLDHPVKGSVYVAAPHDNPFGSLLAIYIAVHDPESGVVLKLPGKVTPDPQTGQLTTTFDDNPQLPFEDFVLDFFGGPGASLMTPPTCGEYTTTTDMRPWSENGDKHPFDSFSIDSGPNGGSCASTPAALPNRQSLSAGTINPVAGDETPFVLNLSRDDGTQRLSRIDTVLPPGLVGKLAGIPYCPEAALAAAVGKTGAAELAAPSCPAASRVGSVRVGAGAGPQPYFVNGTAYLAGPYKGAPISLAVVTPAVAGPFDLGNVVVRVALYVDPVTTQITAKSDALPQILEGIPLDVRSIRLQTDITRNPTSCEPMAVGGTAFSVLNQASPLSERFQVGSCADLGFKPRLFTRLFGRTRRGGNPRFRAVLTMPSSGQANIARTAVTLPHSEFLDQSHIGTVCTRVQYAAHACPAASIYGFAKAWSPLLDEPLQGPVYLRSSSHELPDLVASLDGQIHVDLDGRIDSVHGGIRTIFAAVPDAPVSKFMLSMKGGKKGLLENSTNICAKTHRAVAKFTGHNGARSKSKPKLKASCGKHKRHRRHDRRW
jgi:hypothetical protein